MVHVLSQLMTVVTLALLIQSSGKRGEEEVVKHMTLAQVANSGSLSKDADPKAETSDTPKDKTKDSGSETPKDKTKDGGDTSKDSEGGKKDTKEPAKSNAFSSSVSSTHLLLCL